MNGADIFEICAHEGLFRKLMEVQHSDKARYGFETQYQNRYHFFVCSYFPQTPWNPFVLEVKIMEWLLQYFCIIRQFPRRTRKLYQVEMTLGSFCLFVCFLSSVGIPMKLNSSWWFVFKIAVCNKSFMIDCILTTWWCEEQKHVLVLWFVRLD